MKHHVNIFNLFKLLNYTNLSHFGTLMLLVLTLEDTLYLYLALKSIIYLDKTKQIKRMTIFFIKCFQLL
ncbi:hypothetical protein BpHYR1_047405 [Brachionus plicatilis]|uniref:Uncharacterized protein n=1 Tax=Brachionus plicatilis TaxID=10195 RepID=A0A3M7T6E9_BRAPC|nr:hypothetical protein BpHYR1_047405 [Brachionus plicatilis]